MLVNPLTDPTSQETNVQKMVTILTKTRLNHPDWVRDEWTIYEIDENMKKLRSEFSSSSRPDSFWKIVFQENIFGRKKYGALEELVKTMLVLPHGNADAERGFSENSFIVTDTRIPLSEYTISSLRLVKDVVKIYGSPYKVPISKSLLKSVSLSRKNYDI